MSVSVKRVVQTGLIGLFLVIYSIWLTFNRGLFQHFLSIKYWYPFRNGNRHTIKVNLIDENSAKFVQRPADTEDEPFFSPSKYYCNDINFSAATPIQEGKGEPGWKLKQVQVLIRHGDRTPLYYDLYKEKKIIPNFCNIGDEKYSSKYPFLVEYRKTISRQHTAMYDNIWYKFSNLPIPLTQFCVQGQLTTLGVLHQLKNGFLLKEAYIQKHKLLDSKSLYHTVQVKSTKRDRTVQSAFAFLYGLLPDCNLFKIPFSFAPDLFFCESNYCGCKHAKNIKSLMNAIKHEVYTERLRNNPVMRKLASLSRLSDRPVHIQMDALVTGFLCQGLELPCDNTGYCITRNDLEVVMNELENMNKHLFEKTPLRNLSMLNMQPMLKMISNEMHKKITNDKDALNMLLYSAHDTTVIPLLQALGIPEFRWPRLASMLIFELWEKDGDNYLKVIFNGVDVTSELSFCKDTTPEQGCPYKKFHNFIETGIPKTFGFDTRKEACAAT